jgi:uncharacterized protein YbbK (DUF523 family)
MYLVSACLLGVKCKYSGGDNSSNKIIELSRSEVLIPVCPEQLGGCTTPRPQSEICCGCGADVLDGKCRVKTITGEDVTQQFIKGAEETLRIAGIYGAKKAILKARSPSCGCCSIYDGTFSGTLRDGSGVTAELLKRNGIEVYTEENFRK